MTRRTVDSTAFRQALGHFCTGVTVISVGTGEEIRAMTASAFSSVSLDPPMVLLCMGAQSRVLQAIETSGRYAISILSHEQEAVSAHFGRMSTTPVPFDFASWEGLPVIADALVHLAVDLRELIAAGDHVICLGQVTATAVSTGEPLVYFRGGYHARADRHST